MFKISDNLNSSFSNYTNFKCTVLKFLQLKQRLPFGNSIMATECIHATVDGVIFCDGLECVDVKHKSRASTARKLPD